MTNAEAIARTIAGRGVDTVFGLPGGEILAFVEACRRERLRFLLTGHEASAAWMAQVTGQLTGVPGVCAATLGPGASNLATGVASALLERAPMLAITAQTANRDAPTATHQRLDLARMFEPISKGASTIGKGDTAQITHAALELAVKPRAGPVHLALPSDVAVANCESGNADVGSEEAPTIATGIAQVAQRIASSKRPLVLIGLGAAPACAAAIAILLDKLASPFVITPKVKGIVSEEHPLFLGVATGMALDREVVATLRAADLVIAIGFDPVESDQTWFASLDVVALDAVSMAEGHYRPLEAIGDLPSLTLELAAAIGAPKPWPAELIAERRAAVSRRFAEGLSAISPLRLIEALRSIFPRDGIATCDVGSHKLAMGQFWRAYQPGTFLMANGLSAMGFGIPAAIAAQLIYPERRVLAVVGDGGMLMMLHDLPLIRESSLPIMIVVLRDASLSLIKLAAERRGFAPFGVDFCAPDFAALARGFGIEALRVESVAQASEFMERALERRAPVLLEAPVDYREYRGVIV
jgi:acetolactate synthase I/II/III large subunit